MSTKSKAEFGSYTPDELRELYRTDPGYFEEVAGEAIRRACLGRTPEQTIKRQQLQWTIDAQLRRAKTPQERMRVMENIFYVRVFGADGELARLMFNCKGLIQAAGGLDEVPAARKAALYLVKRQREVAETGNDL